MDNDYTPPKAEKDPHGLNPNPEPELHDENDVEGDVEVQATPDGVLPGGVQTPEGYELAATAHFDDQGGSETQLSGLLTNTKIEPRDGISATLDRGAADPSFGIMRVRLISDHQGRVYAFRKDDHSADTTFFTVDFGHGVL